MGLGCGALAVKYFLFLFNLICALLGLAIVGVGVAVYFKIDDIEIAFEEWDIVVVPIVYFILGAIIFVISFFGCCGAIRESRCMTITYSIFLLLVLVAEIVLGVGIFVYGDEIQKEAKTWLEKMWDERFKYFDFWNSAQHALKCCGLTGPTNWLSEGIPDSCCQSSPCTAINSYQIGCQNALDDYLTTYGNILGAIALGFAGVGLFGIVFACCLAYNIRAKSRR